MAAMGFLASKEEQKINSQKENTVYAFDSGHTLSQEDFKLHAVIFGTTGTGKTTSVFLPILYGLMCAGECGLIIDIKGNLREQVRSLAKACEREEDIIEFGLSDTSIPCNIIANMTTNEIYNFLELILDNSMDNRTQNKDFHIRGILQCVQVYEFLCIYSEKKKLAPPTLKDIYDMLINPIKASKLFDEYKERLYDATSSKENNMLHEIEADAFHLFHYEKSSTNPNNRYLDQLNYAINGPRTAIAEVLEVHNTEKNFATKNAAGIDIKNNFYKNRIVILRFQPGSGKVGAMLSRYYITKYYETVFNIKPEDIYDYPSFICIDEFHEVATLNNSSKFSDTAFVAQAREFRASFLASTQSASSLMCNKNDADAVKSFISNCNTRIYFRTDDPMTQQLMDVYDDTIKLHTLKHGHIYLTSYSNSDKELISGLHSVHNAYQKVQRILNDEKNAVSEEEILKTNQVLQGILAREFRREHLALDALALKENAEKEAINKCNKIYDRHNKLECKIQMQAFLQDYIVFFDSLEAQKVYIPLSWQNTIEKAFKSFFEKEEDISIKDILYDEAHNCIQIKVFEEIDEEKIKQSQRREKSLNSLLIESFEEDRSAQI